MYMLIHFPFLPYQSLILILSYLVCSKFPFFRTYIFYPSLGIIQYYTVNPKVFQAHCEHYNTNIYRIRTQGCCVPTDTKILIV